MSKNHFSISRMTICGVLAALFFALTFFSVDVMGVKIVFSSLAVIIAALLYGPVDAFVVGIIGELLEQIMKYGFTPTTALWVLPPALRGLIIGLFILLLPNLLNVRNLKKVKNLVLYFLVLFLAAIVTTLSNTLVYYIDSHIYGYYSYALIFGTLIAKFITGMLVAIVTGTVAIPVCMALTRAGFGKKRGEKK